MTRKNKIIITIFSIAIVLCVLLAIVPTLYSVVMGSGVKTEPLDASNAKPATTEVDGYWNVVHGKGKNTSAAGFTFDEILPSDARSTSGTSYEVNGFVTVTNKTLTTGKVEVNLEALQSDTDKRDSNVRRTILETDKYPLASFEITKPADVSQLPADGTPGKVELTGNLTIHGQTQELTHTFDAVRDENAVIVSGTVPLRRMDFGVTSYEFLAAKIAELGELNIRIYFEKSEN